MPILILLDGHNFKIITKLLQNNAFLFMKTINQDLVPNQMEYEDDTQELRKEILPPSFSRDRDIHNISLLISVPAVIGLVCKECEVLKIQILLNVGYFKSNSFYFKLVSLWCTTLTLILSKEGSAKTAF